MGVGWNLARFGGGPVEGAAALRGLSPRGTPTSWTRALQSELRGWEVRGAFCYDRLAPCIDLARAHRSVKSRKEICLMF